MLKFEESARIIASESRYVAGGVNSNFRLGMGHGPLVFTHGEGAYLYALDLRPAVQDTPPFIVITPVAAAQPATVETAPTTPSSTLQ